MSPSACVKFDVLIYLFSARNSHETRYMELLACLIAFTGTDFTRYIYFFICLVYVFV